MNKFILLLLLFLSLSIDYVFAQESVTLEIKKDTTYRSTILENIIGISVTVKNKSADWFVVKHPTANNRGTGKDFMWNIHISGIDGVSYSIEEMGYWFGKFPDDINIRPYSEYSFMLLISAGSIVPKTELKVFNLFIELCLLRQKLLEPPLTITSNRIVITL